MQRRGGRRHTKSALSALLLRKVHKTISCYVLDDDLWVLSSYADSGVRGSLSAGGTRCRNGYELSYVAAIAGDELATPVHFASPMPLHYQT